MFKNVGDQDLSPRSSFLCLCLCYSHKLL